MKILSKTKIIYPDIFPKQVDYSNINGPCVFKRPDWLDGDKKYKMLFAHHRGKFIRQADADKILGPWTVSKKPFLHLDDTQCEDHIASPEIFPGPHNDRIQLYYHGIDKSSGLQKTFSCRINNDNTKCFWKDYDVSFYFRICPVLKKGQISYNGIAKNNNIGGILCKSNPFTGHWYETYEVIPRMRHACFILDNYILYTKIGDMPERIYKCRYDKIRDNENYEEEILRPTEDWEGINYSLEPSKPGMATLVNQVRDPYYFEDETGQYIFYSYGGEMGIAVAKVEL